LKTAIIFGVNGQDGFYLSMLLQKIEFKVIGIARTDSNTDLKSFESVGELVRKTTPDYIFHLAANSTTRHDALFENHATISTGTFNILEAVKIYSPQTKVFISGSGLQFVNTEKPIKESDNFEARDAYSVSRIQSVYAARYYRKLGLQVYVGYFFNHDSPRRTERHMAKKISEAVLRISNGSDEKLSIGDISVIKEWTYAGDIVEGIWTLVLQDKIFEANISSGLGYSIEQWLNICFECVGKKWPDHVILKNDFNPEYKMLVSDPSIIHSLGWSPKVSFNEMAKMMMNQ
jgi:GDPmannose 4,6-dehydratase